MKMISQNKLNETGLPDIFTNRQSGCLPVPPHPKLKKQMDRMLKLLKREKKNDFLINKLTVTEDVCAGLNDGLIYPGSHFPLGTSMAPARAARSQKQPLSGDVNVLVVLVDFPDQEMNTPVTHFQDLFFSEGKIATGSVREYYKEVTNGKINIKGDVIGPVRLPQAITTYAHNNSGMGNALPNARTMARDAALALPSGIDLALYDNDHDGYVDAFIIIHAGTGAEMTNNASQIWSHKWLIDGDPYTPAGSSTKLYGYLTVPEDCKLGVCAHELGHLLFGFPDLYDTTYKSEGIGNWCLMSGGSWNNNGDTPAHPCAWCKANQGWVSVVVPNENLKELSIGDVKTDFKVLKLWKNGVPENEYFLIENRQKEKFDKFLSGSGLLIWHIDEAMDDNSNAKHYKVGLMQADGRSDLEKNRNPGDNGDPYPGSAKNTGFGKTTIPGSTSYGGLDTGIQISDIQLVGKNVICDVVIK